jgi:uncharacterized protein (TIGR03382 family)
MKLSLNCRFLKYSLTCAFVLTGSVWDATVASARTPGIEKCPTDPTDGRVVADATIVYVEPNTYKCVPRTEPLGPEDPATGLPQQVVAPTSDTGCIVVTNSPYCGEIFVLGPIGGTTRPPDSISVTIDGIVRQTNLSTSAWTVCGLAPGNHKVTGCAPSGQLACDFDITAGTRTIVTAVRVEPHLRHLRLRVERARVGAIAPGTELTVIFDNEIPVDPRRPPPGLSGRYFEAPSHATFTWRTSDAKQRARMCESPSSGPGCARCSASGGPPGTLVIFLIAIALVLLPRRRPRHVGIPIR